MEDRRDTSGWPTAIRNALRWFGLTREVSVAAMRLGALLIVLGAALLAVPGTGATTYFGGLLWVLGAGMAVRGWLRLMRSRAKRN